MNRWLPRTTKARIGMAILLCFVWLVANRIAIVRDVVAVQDAVQRNYEMGFGPDGYEPPRLLPAAMDGQVEKILGKIFANTRGTTNRDLIFLERFRAFFRVRLRDVQIYYPEDFTDELGIALKRLKALRRLTIVETDGKRPLEASWKQLMRDLRAMPKLQTLEIGGPELNDDALGPLAGHPGLESVTLLEGRLTPHGARMFQTMPRLKSLHIEGMRHDGTAWMTPKEIKTLQEEMPGVNVDIP